MKLRDIFKAGINRRSLLKAAGLSSVGAMLCPTFAAWGKTSEKKSSDLIQARWNTDGDGNTYFLHNTINADNVKHDGTGGNIAAKMDWWWKRYTLNEFDEEFHDWWIEEKSWYYEQLLAFFEDEKEAHEIPNGGHHHPMLATYGRHFFRRGDNTDFHLNCAPKGMTICPKEDMIEYINREVDKVYETGKIPEDLFRLRRDLYKDKSLWLKDRFTTLELYSGRPINEKDDQGPYGFAPTVSGIEETKTFQNLITNPMATVTYMSLYNTKGGEPYFDGGSGLTPTWTFKGFCKLVAFYNPENSEYENKMAKYVNDAHARYHGGAIDIALNLFFIVEQFNETPGYGPGRGKRAVPSYSYSSRTARASNAGNIIKKGKKLSRQDKIELVKGLKIPV